MIRFSLSKKLISAEGEISLEVDISLPSNSFVTLYGISGAGKTSVLRMLAGLMKADSGYIEVDSSVWFDSANGIHLSPQERNIGYVFQDYALFPHMTIEENLAYGLEKGQSKEIIHELIELMELTGLRKRKPGTLSGGQQQRVALARALVRKPALLMLDEPLSALDREMRNKLQDYLLRIHATFQLTTILVSHEIREIFKLSQWVIVLNQGKIQQQGSPYDIFSHRTLSGKFQFIGEIVQIHKEEVIYVFTILIGQQFVRIVIDEEEAKQFSIGEEVIVASKAFNPIIQKIK